MVVFLINQDEDINVQLSLRPESVLSLFLFFLSVGFYNAESSPTRLHLLCYFYHVFIVCLVSSIAFELPKQSDRPVSLFLLTNNISFNSSVGSTFFRGFCLFISLGIKLTGIFRHLKSLLFF